MVFSSNSKVCSRCKSRKPLRAFNKTNWRGCLDGRVSICKQCVKIRKIEYKNSSEHRTHNRIYQRTYAQTHPEKTRAKRERFQQKNHERLLPYWRNWYYAHKESRLAYGRKRRALLRYLVLEKIGLKCRRCGETDLRVLQINHKNGGGSNDFKQPHGRGRISVQLYCAILNGTRLTDDLETLCANCNIIYEYERGYRTITLGFNEIKQFLIENPQIRYRPVQEIRKALIHDLQAAGAVSRAGTLEQSGIAIVLICADGS